MIIWVITLLSVTYIFAIEIYDNKLNKLQQIMSKVSLENIQYEDIGVQFTAIEYDQELNRNQLKVMGEEMASTLALDTACSNMCTLQHTSMATTIIDEEEDCIKSQIHESGEGWAYELKLKNQQDIHHNTYYELSIHGQDIEKLDSLRNRGMNQLNKWGLNISEGIYFKGSIEGKLSDKEQIEYMEQLFDHLHAKSTSYYEDDLTDSTRVYYGYTPLFKESIKDANGNKTNMQVGFKYNDELNQSEMIIAFPFYNEPF